MRVTKAEPERRFLESRRIATAKVYADEARAAYPREETHPADEKEGIRWPFICYQCGREFSVRVHLGVTPSKHVPHCVPCMEAAKRAG